MDLRLALLAYSLFPLTMATALVVAWSGLHMNIEPAAIIGLASTFTLIVCVIFERVLPFKPHWNNSQGDVMTDILHNLINSYGFRELFKILLLAGLAPVVVYLALNYGFNVWPNGLPLWLQVIIIAIIAEFGNYWAHRLSHETDFFWRFHCVHHSPIRLYWLNAGRDHPFGVLLFYVAGATPLILLGVPKEALCLYYVIEAVHGLFQHANINVRLGPLNWIFSMAELHRWHHSKVVKEANNNYGLTLIIWDIVFKTRFLPNRKAPNDIGIQDMPTFPKKFLNQMIVPFSWRRLKYESQKYLGQAE